MRVKNPVSAAWCGSRILSRAAPCGPIKVFLKILINVFYSLSGREGVKSENFSVEERRGEQGVTDGSVRKKRSF